MYQLVHGYGQKGKMRGRKLTVLVLVQLKEQRVKPYGVRVTEPVLAQLYSQHANTIHTAEHIIG
jgi:hypothetical protein